MALERRPRHPLMPRGSTRTRRSAARTPCTSWPSPAPCHLPPHPPPRTRPPFRRCRRRAWPFATGEHCAQSWLRGTARRRLGGPCARHRRSIWRRRRAAARCRPCADSTRFHAWPLSRTGSSTRARAPCSWAPRETCGAPAGSTRATQPSAPSPSLGRTPAQTPRGCRPCRRSRRCAASWPRAAHSPRSPPAAAPRPSAGAGRPSAAACARARQPATPPARPSAGRGSRPSAPAACRRPAG